MDGMAEQYFDTTPQSEEPLDASWRAGGYALHDEPLMLKAGTQKVTMTFDDLLDDDYRIRTRHDDDLRAMIARSKIAKIMSE